MKGARTVKYEATGLGRAGVSGLLVALGLALVASPAHAQVSGTTRKPLPNVLLLVDTSGSMERMTDSTLPICSPGTESEPNRWGMLLQALTGNLLPYYSCEALSRASGSRFTKEYSIAGIQPYDRDYFLPYHRPMTGTTSNTCVVAPWKLPGTTSAGVGPSQNGAGGNANDFTDDAIATVERDYLNAQLDANASLQTPNIPNSRECIFSQAPDGQLDAARDYARFALMTFDSEPSEKLGITGTFTGVNAVNATAPFEGQWSYLRSPSNPFYSSAANVGGVGAQGAPLTTPACTPAFFEVGARHEGAPPWEGRLIRFPDPYGTLFDVQKTNAQIQQVLLASRPFGATPIDGMMDDARDYLWYSDRGPKDDPFTCREKYIILLTDGAPNLDLRPACTGGTWPSTGPGGVCPYPLNAGEIAASMATDADVTKRVRTFVIGFSVNGTNAFPLVNDGFPVGVNNCKTWYQNVGATPGAMKTECDSRITSGLIPQGSTADACCKLNEIALKGSDDGVNAPIGAFFAESQADIVLSFGRILANITSEASTRTVPAFTPSAQFSTASFAPTARSSAEYLASFIPNTQRPWSGEIERKRFQCNTSLVSEAQPVDTAKGDVMSANLAAQSASKTRFFFSVIGDKVGGEIDSAATIRPFANPATPSFTGGDGIVRPDAAVATYSGREKAMLNYDLTFDADWPLALDIDNRTCRRSRAACAAGDPGCTRGTRIVPALDGTTGASRCSQVIWGFATAYPDALSFSGTPASAGSYDFNVRCRGAGSTTAGKCSVSGTSCTIGSSTGCRTGEVCVPECAALGAVFHSNPAVVGAPSGLLREEGFRNFQAGRRGRRMLTYVATTDGLLHAFKSLDESGTNGNHELWAFAPPAVLPRLATNYPVGNQVILDGSPVVREAVWERTPAQESGTAASSQWHTTLVAGLGAEGRGYYALNVTDDCSGGECTTRYEQPTQGALGEVSTHGTIDASPTKRGPHFLWQLTDVPEDTSDPAKYVRRSPIAASGSGARMVGLFGRKTGTPAIATVQIKSATTSEERQVGVAILPGGLEDPPFSGPGTGLGNKTCARRGGSGLHDGTVGSVRPAVRKWARSCTDPVPGRGLTIVRLDNGEIIRHFGRTTQDVPKRVQAKTIDTDLDSPIVGTPVVFPDALGVPIQKIFVGDADGTMWRVDLTSTNPSNWRMTLFQDLYADAGGDPQAALRGQPIEITPIISTDPGGNIVLDVATGDQDTVSRSTETNFVYSLTETRDSTNAYKARINWFETLTDGHRVTGPMVLFDRSLYFASFEPAAPTSGPGCGGAGTARLWGLHYTQRKTTTSPSDGGTPLWCPDGSVDAVTGVCSVAFVKNETRGTDLIPGVALRASATCSELQASAGDELGGFSYKTMTPMQYTLTAGVSRPATSGSSTPTAARLNITRPLPRTSTRIDSWSIVIE
jgi:type IV pilus assembly protein PilY1